MPLFSFFSQSFTITVDVVVVEVIRKQCTTASGLESLSVDGAIQQVRVREDRWASGIEKQLALPSS